MALGRNITPGMGEKYYRKDDYYVTREGGEDHRLEWTGKLAEEMGLSGKVDAEDWSNALHGHFPNGVEIGGGSMKDPETGELVHRAGTDFEFSAPKSVSIQALVFGDERLIEIHKEAARAAIAFLEEQVGARRGHAGKTWETTGRGLVGWVTHFTSREGDPHLHVHGVFLNITQNAEGNFQAMTNDRMFEYQRAAQEVYHSVLSRRSAEIGYDLEKGRYEEPQLAGYTREQIEYFSGRAAQIEAYLREKWGLEWREMSREERNEKRWMKEEAWERTRKAKKAKELEGLQAGWLSEAQAVGAEKVTPEKAVRSFPPEMRRDIARDALTFALEHHTEREAAVPEGELIRTALQASRGIVTWEDLERTLKDFVAEKTLIRQKDDLAGSRQNLVTSREALEREKRILGYEKAGRKAVRSILNPFQAEAALRAVQAREGIRLNDEQKAAAALILTADNRYVGINGFAGVGKTTMLKPAIESLKGTRIGGILSDAGYRVIGLGPQHSAVHALKDAGIIEGETLQAWLANRKAGQELDEKTVIVIDEAGLANAKDLESAMKRIEKTGARAILVGDAKQYESVAAGPAFRQLQQNGMETVYVTEMQRQKNAPENVREAAKASVSDPAKALELLERNITEIRNPEARTKALAEAFMKSPDQRDTLVLTGTHDARKAVNEHVRTSLGLAGSGLEFNRFEAGDFTEAQKKRIGSYETGQEIRFGKDYRSMRVTSGEVGKVASVDKENGTVILRMSDSRTVAMTPRDMSGKGHEIGSVEKIELSRGDRIRITGNERKKEGITNGMRGEIIDVSRSRIMIRFDSGLEASLPVSGTKPLEIDHGYAQTGHSAQGLGAGTVILDLPSGSQTLNRRSFYTNLTRTKGVVIAFTDDRERLTKAVTREKDKTMALEVEEPARERIREERKEKVSERELSPDPREGAKKIRAEAEKIREDVQKPEKRTPTPMEEKKREENTRDREKEKEQEQIKERPQRRRERDGMGF